MNVMCRFGSCIVMFLVIGLGELVSRQCCFCGIVFVVLLLKWKGWLVCEGRDWEDGEEVEDVERVEEDSMVDRKVMIRILMIQIIVLIKIMIVLVYLKQIRVLLWDFDVVVCCLFGLLLFVVELFY